MKKNKLRRHRNVVEKSQSQSKTFDVIDVRLYLRSIAIKKSFATLLEVVR